MNIEVVTLFLTLSGLDKTELWSQESRILIPASSFIIYYYLYEFGPVTYPL